MEIGEEGEGPQRTHTSYYNSKGEELTFVQAREKRLNLDSDVGKKKVCIVLQFLYLDYQGCDKRERVWWLLVRCV